MAEKIKLVHGDTKPAIVVSLTDANSGGALGLNGSTVRMYFRAVGGSAILATLNAQLLPGVVNDDGTITTTAPYNTLGSGGRLQFSWGVTDLNQDAGDYEGEIEITYPDGSIQTVYDLLKFKLRKDF